MNTNKVELTAAVIISFVLLGKYLEARAKQQTTAAIQALQALMPEVAQVKRAGKEKIIPISEIQLGDFIIVKPLISTRKTVNCISRSPAPTSTKASGAQL